MEISFLLARVCTVGVIKDSGILTEDLDSSQ